MIRSAERSKPLPKTSVFFSMQYSIVASEYDATS